MAVINRSKARAGFGSLQRGNRAGTLFFAEHLEPRKLLSVSLTVGAVGDPGSAPLQVTSGESVTLTADVQQSNNSDAIAANPTGTVTFFWFEPSGEAGQFIGNASNSVVVTQNLDTQFSATFNLTQPPFVEEDSFGDILVIASYSGDSNFPRTNSYIGGNQVSDGFPLTRVDSALRYVPVDFVSAPSTTTLGVSVQPSNTAVAAKIDPPVQVSVFNGSSVDTSASTAITASITPGGTGTGKLTGATTVNTLAGVATFSNLSIDTAGEYTLTFTDSSSDTTVSHSFQIGGGLGIRVQPSTTSPGDPIAPAVKVAVLNPAGKPDTTAAPTTITAALSSDSTGTGALTGSLSATTVRGVATFSNLRIDKPGDYTLDFSDTDGISVSSVEFTISTGRLIFVGRIGRGIPGTALKPALEVQLVDKHGHRLNDVSSLVTLNITGTNSADPITGNTAQLANGTAIFSNLQFAQPGDYTLSATDDEDDAKGVSNSISITGLHLAFRLQPGEVSTNAALKYEVDLEDYKNRVVNDSSIGLALSLSVIKDGTDAALSSTADTIDFGRAVNSGINPASINAPGQYQVSYSAITQGSDIAYTIDPITSKPFEVVAYHLDVVRNPKTVLAGFPISYVVELEDYRDRIVKINRPDQLTVTLLPESSSSTGVLSSNIDHLSNGFANNSSGLLTISANGKYKLMVQDVPANPSDAVASSATSGVFKIGVGIFG
jgi:hypothetical protein